VTVSHVCVRCGTIECGCFQDHFTAPVSVIMAFVTGFMKASLFSAMINLTGCQAIYSRNGQAGLVPSTVSTFVS
jgi:ABC-type transporter Mla maintaining outer membrane lipid asymmetry permease subunit MlaE